MKLLNNSKQTLGRTAVPRIEQIKYGRKIGRILQKDCGYDPDRWARYLGYHLFRSKSLDPELPAALMDGKIFILDGLGRTDELLAIGHEHTHHIFHAECVAYRDLDLFQHEKHEAEANGVASVCLYHDMRIFATEEEFRSTSVMPDTFTEIRLRILRKHRL